MGFRNTAHDNCNHHVHLDDPPSPNVHTGLAPKEEQSPCGLRRRRCPPRCAHAVASGSDVLSDHVPDLFEHDLHRIQESPSGS